MINQTVTGVNIKQINIIPTLSIFNNNILTQVDNFEQYRISSVSVHFLDLDNVSYQQGANTQELLYFHEVPLNNETIPQPS